MIIVGEKLNSSIPKTLEALNNRDSAYITDLIKKQADSGADYIDLNTALTGEKEIENMLWLIELVQENSTCGIMIDSPNKDIISNCILKVKNRKLIINSITLDEGYDNLIEIANQNGAGIVCLPLKDKAIPHTADKRFEFAQKLIEKLRYAGIEDKNIYIDVLLEAVATNESAVTTSLRTINLIKENFPEVNTICGLSNVSFGLPRRANLNATFLSMALQNGLTSAILDICCKSVKNSLFAANALIGKDEYCMEYINYNRNA